MPLDLLAPAGNLNPAGHEPGDVTLPLASLPIGTLPR